MFRIYVAATLFAAMIFGGCALPDGGGEGSRPAIATSVQEVVGDPTCTDERMRSGNCDLVLVTPNGECGTGCVAERAYRDLTVDVGRSPSIYERGYVPGTGIATSRIWVRDMFALWRGACTNYTGPYPRCTVHANYLSSSGAIALRVQLTSTAMSTEPPLIDAWLYDSHGPTTVLVSYTVAYDIDESTFGMTVSARESQRIMPPTDPYYTTMWPSNSGNKLFYAFPGWQMR